MALPPGEKLAMMRDPAGRARMNDLAQATEGSVRAIANWGTYVIMETFSPDYKRFIGRAIGEVATELGKSAWDTLCDIVVADNLRTAIANPDRGLDDATWARRLEVWRDPRALVGASDAGAHLDMIDSFALPTQLLGKAVRERSLLPIEEAIHYLTGAPVEALRPARSWAPRDRQTRRHRGARPCVDRTWRSVHTVRPASRRRSPVQRSHRHRTCAGQRTGVR